MSLNFQLTSKETGKVARLNNVDEQICEFLDVPVHPERWCAGWFDSLGFCIAMENDIVNGMRRCQGWSLEHFHCADHDADCSAFVYRFEVIGMIGRFLDQHYTVQSWTGIGR